MRPRRELKQFEQDYVASVGSDLSDRAPEQVRRAAASYAQNLIENDYPVIFDLAHLAVVLGVNEGQLSFMGARPEGFYSCFRLQKRRGGSRLIEAPHRELKAVQHWVQAHVTRKLPVHEAAHGFREGRSIVSNAESHVGRCLIVKYDVKDFFGSVAEVTVFRIFRRVGYTRAIAHLLTRLTTLRGALPQGAPTSPDLANVAAYRLDARLSGLASRHEVNYTRYADDLTFSGAGVANPSSGVQSSTSCGAAGLAPTRRRLRFFVRRTSSA
jgi:hypothetical protein